MNKLFSDIVKTQAEKLFVDPALALAITQKESGWVPWRTKFEPKWAYLYSPSVFAKSLLISLESEVNLQMTSFGLMQVMGSVARELGFDDYLVKLCSPDIGAWYGVKKISKLMGKYPDMNDVISAYNAGHPQKDEKEKYVNQAYVSDVLIYYNFFKDNQDAEPSS